MNLLDKPVISDLNQLREAYEEEQRKLQERLIQEQEEVRQKVIYQTPIKWGAQKGRPVEITEEYLPTVNTNLLNKSSSWSDPGLGAKPTTSTSTVTSLKPTETSTPLEGIKVFMEPFAGGLATTYRVAQTAPSIEKFYISDCLYTLINYYACLAMTADNFMQILETMKANYNNQSISTKKEYYNSIKEWYNQLSIPWLKCPLESRGISPELAAGFYFLTTTSFNNYFKINSSNRFCGTPIAASTRSSSVEMTPEQLQIYKDILEKSQLEHADYKESLKAVDNYISKGYKPEEIVVLLDPPVNFSESIAQGASLDIEYFNPDRNSSYEEFASYCSTLTDKGIKWILTLPEEKLDIFKEYYSNNIAVAKCDLLDIRNPLKRRQDYFVTNYS